MKNIQNTDSTFNFKKFILHLLLCSILGIIISVFIIYKVFPYKLINSNQFYELVIIDSGFADFFHSIFPIPVENKVKFKKVESIYDPLDTDELPFLPIKQRGILTKHKSEYLYRKMELVDLYIDEMTDDEWYEFEMKNNSPFRQIDDDDE